MAKYLQLNYDLSEELWNDGFIDIDVLEALQERHKKSRCKL